MTKAFLDKYGNPCPNNDGILDVVWTAMNLSVFALPFPMRLSWIPSAKVTRFQAHKLAGPKIVAALTSVLAFMPYEQLKNKQLDLWGGCFNFRLVRGGTELSAHAWGTAVDIAPDLGRLGNKEDVKTYPRFIVSAFEKEGFYWGGNFARPDAMHFELQQ